VLVRRPIDFWHPTGGRRSPRRGIDAVGGQDAANRAGRHATTQSRQLALDARDDPPAQPTSVRALERVRRRDVLGGLIHEYELVAA